MIVGILGSTGFVGQNLQTELREQNIQFYGGSRRIGLDVTDHNQLIDWILHYRITHLINLAAECGGIGLNQKRPADLWHSTAKITSNVLYTTMRAKIERLIMVGTICSYPSICPIPFKEEYLMNYGPPEVTNRAYGVAKLSALYGAQAYIKQYEMKINNLIPVNMYGPMDHFDPEISHVIPAMIRKMYLGKKNNQPKVELWGTGIASREFLHARDFARAAILALHIDTDGQFINIGTNSEITIHDLAILIAKLIGYEGELIWDPSRPDGQPRRCLDITRARTLLGYKPSITLEDGLKGTIEWYLNNNKDDAQ